MGRLFGTDGIRGRANQHPITCELALKTGRAVARLILKQNKTRLVIGKDTRESGDMLEAALASGAASAGVDVLLAGVIPTPGVAYFTQEVHGVGAGVVISASHNPYYDNGIKIFGAGGLKLSDDDQEYVESLILDDEEKNVSQDNAGKISVFSEGCKLYADFLKTKFPKRKPDSPIRIIADASNGAASIVGPMVFDKNDYFDVQWIHCSPDGRNINKNCGSQHLGDLKKAVQNQKSDIGIAFDGDADRLIAVDHTGMEITGDRILAICGKFAKDSNRLDTNMVVSTIMSNIGLSQCLKTLEIDHAISDVGDRMVLEKMKETGAVIGGEDSGHMIFLNDHSTGDGLLSSIKLLEVMAMTNKSLHELSQVMTVFPQILMNVTVDESRPDFTQIKGIADTIESVEKRLGQGGRVLVRYSGTQPLLRVMVEGPKEDVTQSYCEEICRAIKTHI